jgi:hypothetical protein
LNAAPFRTEATPHLLEATTMARQQAAQRPVDQTVGSKGGAGAQPQQQQQTSTLIQFEPQLAVRAIVFHLVDEGITEQVGDDSIRATVVRLQRASIAPAVEQWMWAEMSHAQRLQWLLEKTHTAARLVSDELSVLEPARGKPRAPHLKTPRSPGNRRAGVPGAASISVSPMPKVAVLRDLCRSRVEEHRSASTPARGTRTTP